MFEGLHLSLLVKRLTTNVNLIYILSTLSDI